MNKLECPHCRHPCNEPLVGECVFTVCINCLVWLVWNTPVWEVASESDIEGMQDETWERVLEQTKETLRARHFMEQQAAMASMNKSFMDLPTLHGFFSPDPPK